jgi:formylglycine-generating enzyme required for sulfatase activity
LESKSYRLPTEAEWEYACRAGTTSRFQNSDDASGLLTVANVSDIAYVRLLAGGDAPAEAVERGIALGVIVGGDDHSTFTSPVGRFKPNGFGVQDMHGNAATWCADWYDPNYYATSGTNNPTGPTSGRLRAVRGGSWQFYPHMCRSASRNACDPLRRETFLGMRVVREIDYPSGTR